jgi:hypothetical protein
LNVNKKNSDFQIKSLTVCPFIEVSKLSSLENDLHDGLASELLKLMTIDAAAWILMSEAWYKTFKGDLSRDSRLQVFFYHKS